MQKNRLFFYLILLPLNISLSHANWSDSPFFNTKLLKNTAKTAEKLKQIGYKEGYFKSPDGITLNYLWLARPKARYTLIASSGFYPGRKEGLATLHALLPADCNIFFFDSRGRGKSEGTIINNLIDYSQKEYLDVQGAINWVANHTKTPIILYGICAGAYHSTYALTKKPNKRVKGLIFDSGWVYVGDAASNTLHTTLRQLLTPKIKTLLGRKELANALKGSARITARGLGLLLTYLIIKPTLWTQANFNLLHNPTLEVPVLFIHAYDDTAAPIKPVQQLASQTKNASTWWIKEPSSHAAHHLKHKHAYKAKLDQFITTLKLP